MNASSGSINDRHRCWAEIDLAQLRRNLAVYRAQLPAGSNAAWREALWPEAISMDGLAKRTLCGAAFTVTTHFALFPL